MEKTELIFIPLPEAGHLFPTIEIAKMMTRWDHRLSITIVMMKLPFQSFPGVASDSDSVRFVTLPAVDQVISTGTTGFPYMFELIEAQKPLLRDAVGEIMARSGSVRLGGFVFDMFCTSMRDVADEFGVPSYLFFASSAAVLGFNFHLRFLHVYEGLDLFQFKNSDAELEIPSYVYPVPGKFLPYPLVDKESGFATTVPDQIGTYRQVQGIIVNTFVELESHATRSFSDPTLPPVYHVGPIINTQASQQDTSAIMSWLDDQPVSSVIFLCFGSMGGFGEDQVKEMAHGLEHSGYRFLWSLCQPSSSEMGSSSNYENLEEVLPKGFLDRTAKIGKVIGWAPQKDILAHSSTGGFVSHCGWNSILESIWHGIPIAAWPLFGEQQLNAFQLVKDLGLAVEIKMDYRRNSGYVVSAQEIEIGLKNLMNMKSEVRKKMKEMKNISRKAVREGGSSHFKLGRFIEDMMTNIS